MTSFSFGEDVAEWLWIEEISFNQESCRNLFDLSFFTAWSLEQKFSCVKLDANAPGVILQTVPVDRSYPNRASNLFKEQEHRQQR